MHNHASSTLKQYLICTRSNYACCKINVAKSTTDPWLPGHPCIYMSINLCTPGVQKYITWDIQNMVRYPRLWIVNMLYIPQKYLTLVQLPYAIFFFSFFNARRFSLMWCVSDLIHRRIQFRFLEGTNNHKLLLLSIHCQIRIVTKYAISGSRLLHGPPCELVNVWLDLNLRRSGGR